MIRGKFEQDWAKAPAEMKQQYGEEFGGSFLRVLKLLASWLPSSAEGVVSTIVEAATLTNPKVQILQREHHPSSLFSFIITSLSLFAEN